MRPRLKSFLPIVLIALMVQILAPIGVCWAASIAASDPLAGAVICHGNGGAPAGGQADQTNPRARHGCCSVCSVLHTGAPIDAPQTSTIIAYNRQSTRVVWSEFRSGQFASRAGPHAQARAPPPA
jgi:hypothetical protein